MKRSLEVRNVNQSFDSAILSPGPPIDGIRIID